MNQLFGIMIFCGTILIAVLLLIQFCMVFVCLLGLLDPIQRQPISTLWEPKSFQQLVASWVIMCIPLLPWIILTSRSLGEWLYGFELKLNPLNIQEIDRRLKEKYG